jgi:hypothetical protein
VPPKLREGCWSGASSRCNGDCAYASAVSASARHRDLRQGQRRLAAKSIAPMPEWLVLDVLRPCADDRSLARRRGQQDSSMDRLQWPSVHWERLLEALDVALGDRDRRGEHVPFHHLGSRRRCQGPLVTEEMTGLRQERSWINPASPSSFGAAAISDEKAGLASCPPPSKKTPITIRFPPSPPWTK